MAVAHSALPAIAFLSFASALSQPAAPGQPSARIDATALVRRAVRHRLEAEKEHHPVRYLVHRTDERHDTTKEIVETADGDVARLLAIDGKPLSAEANRAELERLDNLASHPELQQHRLRGEQKDAARVDRLLALLPDAFLYRYEGMAPCSTGQCYRLSFTPNPKFAPPSLEADILRGMAGEVWIDPAQERMARLEAHCIAEVYFGFGILGRLDKGGAAVLEDSDVGEQDRHDWELTSLKLNMTGKALMLKPLSFQVTEEASHFSPVPSGLSYKDAIQMLKQTAP